MRNNAVLAVWAALIAGFTVYWINAVYVFVVSGGERLPLDPSALVEDLEFINENGVWSVFGVTGQGLFLTITEERVLHRVSRAEQAERPHAGTHDFRRGGVRDV